MSEMHGEMQGEMHRMEVELLDLGDAASETRQWFYLPLAYDSIFQLGQRDL